MRFAYLVTSLLASLPLVGCFGGERESTGECPAGEVCSPKTPNGLHFIGDALVDDVLLSGPVPTAVGGTQNVKLEYDRGNGSLVALDIPFTADDDGGIGVTVDHITGAFVVVKGAGSRTNYLRILDADDGTLFDRKQLTGAAVTTIQLVTADFERVPVGKNLAWATGRQNIGVALFGDVQTGSGPESQRLVDTSMALTLAGSERVEWDIVRLPNATVGTSALQVTAGDKPAANVDIVVADHADSLAALTPPTTIPANGSQEVCFMAQAQGRYLAGLVWTYDVDGTTVTKGNGTNDITRNCIVATTTKTTGSVIVKATAGGQTAMATLSVGTGARELPGTVFVPFGYSIPTAGDRAAM
jgi:hypothetical protein